MRRGVVDDLGPVGIEYGIESGRVADRADEHLHPEGGMGVGQFLLNGIGAVFADVEDQQPGRMMRGKLPAELRADGPAAAGDQDDLALHIAGDLLQIDADAVAAQKILDLHFTDRTDIQTARGDLRDGGQDFRFAAGILTDGGQFPQLRRRGAGNGQNDLLHLIAPHHGGDIFSAADNGHAAHALALLERIIVDDADHSVAGGVGLAQILQRHRSGGAGAHQHGAGPAEPLGLPKHGARDPVGIPHDADGQGEEHGVEEGKTAGNAALEHQHDTELNDGNERGGGNDADRFLQAGKFPQARVQTGQPEKQEHHDEIDRKERQQIVHMLRGCHQLELELVAKSQRKNLDETGQQDVHDRKKYDSDEFFSAVRIAHIKKCAAFA